MIKSLYTKYFQKSKSFLYPALGIKKNLKIQPSEIYISIKGIINPEDMRLICSFEKSDSAQFEDFQLNFLIKNPLFLEKIELDKHILYIFDYSSYKIDWFNFILGKYSKFSAPLKKAIKNYYGELSKEYEYIDSYLNPEKYFSEYSNILDVPVEVLKEIGELCDPCDLEKETLVLPKEILQNFEKNIFLK